MKVEIRLTPKQRLAWDAWNNDLCDDVVFGGGAGAGKTRFLTSALAHSALSYPDTRYFIGRKRLEDLMKTTYVTLTQIVLPAWGLENGKHWTFNGGSRIVSFYNGSQINLLHLEEQPSDPLFDRFGSHEYTRGGIDEASEIAFRAYDVLRTRTGRYNNDTHGIKAKLGLTLNPSDQWPYRLFYDPWKKAGRPNDPTQPLISMRGMLDGQEVTRSFVFIQALVADNQHIEQQYRVNLATITDPVLRARLQQGDWEFSSAIDVLFPADVIADLFTNTVKKSKDKYLTVDVARSNDLVVLTYWLGWRAYKIEIHDPKKEGVIPIYKTAEYVRNGFNSEGIPRENVLVDQDGVGGGVLDHLPGCIGFSGNASPFGVTGETKVHEQYENLRAQCIYHLAEKGRERQIAVTDTNIETHELLAADLQQFKRRDPEKSGKLKVTKKEDMKDALGRSPDIGDTLMMRSYFDLRLREEALATTNGHMHVFIPDDFQ